MVQPIPIYREGKLLSLYVRRIGFFRPKLQLMGRFEQEVQKLSPRAPWEKCPKPICRPINPDNIDDLIEATELLQPRARYQFVGVAKALASPRDHCSVIAEARALPPGTPVYARIMLEEQP